MRQYSQHKMGPVTFATEELANGTSRWITTIRLGKYAVFCALDAIRALLDSWIISQLSDEQYVT